MRVLNIYIYIKHLKNLKNKPKTPTIESIKWPWYQHLFWEELWISSLWPEATLVCRPDSATKCKYTADSNVWSVSFNFLPNLNPPHRQTELPLSKILAPHWRWGPAVRLRDPWGHRQLVAQYCCSWTKHLGFLCSFLLFFFLMIFNESCITSDQETAFFKGWEIVFVKVYF